MLNFRPWKISIIVLTLLVGVIAALPNLFARGQLDAMPNWMPTPRAVVCGRTRPPMRLPSSVSWITRE